MDEITAAIIGALLAGPAGFLIERFLSRPRITISYARIEFEDVITLTSESHEALNRLFSFMEWMDNQVPWNFKQSAQGNFFVREEVRILSDLGAHFLKTQKMGIDRIKTYLTILKSDNNVEVQTALFELAPDYYRIFNRQLFEDYNKEPENTLEQLKDHLQATVDNMEKLAIPLLISVIEECQQYLRQGRGTSDRLIVCVGIGNRGIQDGLIEAEASLQTVERVFRLPVKLTKRPWYTDDDKGEAIDSSYIKLPARSFRVIDFLIDENFNARADLDKLVRELRNGTKAQFTAYGLGRRKLASMQFTAKTPDPI